MESYMISNGVVNYIIVDKYKKPEVTGTGRFYKR